MEKEAEKLSHKYLEKNLLKKEFLVFKLLLGNLNRKGLRFKNYNVLIDFLFLFKVKEELLPLVVLKNIIETIKPSIVLINKRRGSVIFELPQMLSKRQEYIYGVKWFINSSGKHKKNLKKNLVQESNLILTKKGEILTKKENIKKKAKDNKPFFYILKP